MTINQFYESMSLCLSPYRTEWQGQNDQVIVLKLWDKDKDKDSPNKRIRCLSSPNEKPTTSNKKGKWERRRVAIQEVRDGCKHGFFTIGFEGGGTQKTYEKFRTDGLYKVNEIQKADDGSLWVYFDGHLVSPEEVRRLNSSG